MNNLCELDSVRNGPPKSQKAPGAEGGEEMGVGEKMSLYVFLYALALVFSNTPFKVSNWLI